MDFGSMNKGSIPFPRAMLKHGRITIPFKQLIEMPVEIYIALQGIALYEAHFGWVSYQRTVENGHETWDLRIHSEQCKLPVFLQDCAMGYVRQVVSPIMYRDELKNLL
jgi:hypothetical protein